MVETNFPADGYLKDLRKSTLGFDLAFDLMDRTLSDLKYNRTPFGLERGWPFYNITQPAENKLIIELSVAGFSINDLNVEIIKNRIDVTGDKKTHTNNQVKYEYKGITDRRFVRSFYIADTIEVTGCDLKDGILRIYLQNNVPEKKTVKIDIKAADDSQIEHKSAQQLLTEETAEKL